MTEAAKTPRAYRYGVGKAEVTVLSDGYRRFPLPDGLVTNATREEVERALAAAEMPPGEMTIHFNPVVIRTDDTTLLIDTGNGPHAADEKDSTRGMLMESLTEAGMAPDEIDTVVISHFHGDHINGLLKADDTPAFPKANVLVPAAEWQFWNDAADDDSASPKIADTARAAQRIFAPIWPRVSVYEWDTELAPGLTAVATPGHTPGHTSFWLKSGGAKVFIQSDLTNNPALFVRHPEWHAAFDMDPDKAEAKRREILEKLSSENVLVQGFHFPFPACGRLEKCFDDGYRLVAR